MRGGRLPAVRTHPGSGCKALFVNRGLTYRINEVLEEESAAILDYLYQHAEKPGFQVRFR